MGISTLQNYTNSIIGPDLFDLKGHLEREEGKELRGERNEGRGAIWNDKMCVTKLYLKYLSSLSLQVLLLLTRKI